MSEPRETSAHTRYEVDCPYCEDTISLEQDPSGSEIECENCDEWMLVTITY